MRKRLDVLGFAVLAVIFVLRQRHLLFDDQHYLLHDNLGYHFPAFVNFVNSLAHGFGFPRLQLGWGGSDIGMSSVSMGYFLPHRLFGYALYLLSPWNPLTVYKLSLLFGVLLNAFGWFLLWRRVFLHPLYAVLGVALFLSSGLGLTYLHHEQMLATLAYVPWCLLFFVKQKQEGRGLPLATAFLGALMTVHYPQIHVLAWGVFFVLMGLFFSPTDFLQGIATRHRIWSGVTLLLGASPAIYLLTIMPEYGSPVRGTEEFSVTTLAEYLKINLQQQSSATWAQLQNLVLPETERGDDQMLFFITSAGFLSAAVGVIAALFSERRWQWLVVFMLFSGWATLGINGGLAQGLFVLHFPMIAQFRQWYHFGHYFVISLITLSLVGVCWWVEGLRRTLAPARTKFLLPAILGLFLLSVWWQSSIQYKEYVYSYTKRFDHVVERFSQDEFLRVFNGRGLDEWLPTTFSTTLVAQKENMNFFKPCGEPPVEKGWRENGTLQTCADFKNLVPVAYPELTWTPSSLLLGGSSQAYIVHLNSRFFEERVETLGGSGLTRLYVDQPTEFKFRTSPFFYTLALQIVAVALGLALCRKRASV